LLLRAQEQYYIKADSTAIVVTNCSCFADAVELLFMCFFVFWVEYPFHLRLFYAFLEKVLDVKTGGCKSKFASLSDFWRRLVTYMPPATETENRVT